MDNNIAAMCTCRVRMFLLTALVIIEQLVTSDSASIAAPSTTTTGTLVGRCQDKLPEHINQCLQKFELTFRVFNDKDSAGHIQNAMGGILCREYEASLLCLHLALQQCPPRDEHLKMMGNRLGHIRLFMTDLCQQQAAAAPPTATSTPPSTTFEEDAPDTVTDSDNYSGSDETLQPQYIFPTTRKHLKTSSGNNKLENEVLEQRDNNSINSAVAGDTDYDNNSGEEILNAAFQTMQIKAEHKRCIGEACETRSSAIGVHHSILSMISLSLIIALNSLS